MRLDYSLQEDYLCPPQPLQLVFIKIQDQVPKVNQKRIWKSFEGQRKEIESSTFFQLIEMCLAIEESKTLKL